MISDQHIPIIYCRVIMATASQSQGDTQRLLAGTNINNQSLKQLDAAITVSDYRQLLENAQLVSGSETTLLDAGLRTPISAHGPLGSAAAHSPDYLTTLHLLRRYIKLRGSFNDVTITSSGSRTRVQFEIGSVMGNQKDNALDFILGVLMSSLMFFPSGYVAIPIVRLTRPASKAQSYYQEQLGCRILYKQKADSISFATKDLQLPLPTFDPEQYNDAVTKCQMLFRHQLGAASARESIENIFEQSPGMLWQIDAVAQRLNISARTLQRRLKAEGSQYQKILDQWLMKSALGYLQQDKLSVEATATLLGYQDEANFRRAYKRWFGRAPRAHLKMLMLDAR